VLAIEALQSMPFFSGLDPQEIDLLSTRFQPEDRPAGHVYFDQGEHADRLYLVVSGKVGIRYKPDDGDVLPVADVGPGGVFGWSAALGRRVYTSSAVGLEDTITLSIRGATLRRLCETHPGTGVVLLERLAEVIAERLRNTHEHVVQLLRQNLQPAPRG
jgi:CRP/FNR family transcriptional regulator, cyclic AMP receptor protein